MMVVGVFDMYVYVDYVFGGWVFVDCFDVLYYFGVEVIDCDVVYEFIVLDDGEMLVVGDYDIEVMYVLGYILDMMNYFVDGWFFFIGDMLFVELVGWMEF